MFNIHSWKTIGFFPSNSLEIEKIYSPKAKRMDHSKQINTVNCGVYALTHEHKPIQIYNIILESSKRLAVIWCDGLKTSRQLSPPLIHITCGF